MVPLSLSLYIYIWKERAGGRKTETDEQRDGDKKMSSSTDGVIQEVNDFFSEIRELMNNFRDERSNSQF